MRLLTVKTKGITEFPKFKSRKKTKPSFYANTAKIKFTSSHVKLEKLTTSRKANKQNKKKRRLQRRVSQKYAKNKKGESYCRTCNIVKSKRKLLKVNHRLTNIRHSYLHSVTSEIVSRKLKFIVLEDLNIQGMMKNRHLSRSIQEQCFYEFYRQIEYKCRWQNIKFITADRYYPSSKMCSCCGNIKKYLKLSDRVYNCSVCGLTIDRDFQASINLMNYGLTA